MSGIMFYQGIIHRIQGLCSVLIILTPIGINAQIRENMNNQKVDGYRGIWFESNQEYEYGDKYSGGMGTYTAKHIPMAIYAPVVDKTFFVYGGTTGDNSRHLLCMIGMYDHKTQMVCKPTVVRDKLGIHHPHDNPSMMIDGSGYVWVFVSSRGNRAGIKMRSARPHDISEFRQVSREVFAYPQIWNTREGFIHFFTKYTGERELYF
jgi:hypothetical protein